MGMKKSNAMLGIMGMALAMSGESMHYDEIKKPESMLTDEEKARRKFLAKDSQMIKKGCKRFYYGEKFLYALNQKNADRKAKKKGWI